MISGILLLAVLFLLILIGVPVGYAFLASGLIFVLLTLDVPSAPLIAHATTSGADSVSLTAIPLFLLAGSLMNAGGITRRLVDLAAVFFGRLPGGLGVVNVGANLFFSGVSGSAVAGASAIGKSLIPEMTAKGYPRSFSAALTSTGSILGGTIPPAIPLIVYAIAADQEIRPLLTAGIVPGLILAVLLAISVVLLSVWRKYPRQGRVSLQDALTIARRAIGTVFMPVIILGGILSGWFTATEAAAVAVLYALFLSTVVYRELSWRRLPAVFMEAARSSAVILFIVAAAAVIGQVFVRTGMPEELGILLGGFSPILFLLVVNLMLLLFGTFMEANAAIIIFTPLLLPTAEILGIDPIHLGVVMVFNLMVGLVTPPVGMSLFVTSNIAKVSVLAVAKANLPFLGAALVTLFLITFWPELSLLLV